MLRKLLIALLLVLAAPLVVQAEVVTEDYYEGHRWTDYYHPDWYGVTADDRWRQWDGYGGFEVAWLITYDDQTLDYTYSYTFSDKYGCSPDTLTRTPWLSAKYGA